MLKCEGQQNLILTERQSGHINATSSHIGADHKPDLAVLMKKQKTKKQHTNKLHHQYQHTATTIITHQSPNASQNHHRRHYYDVITWMDTHCT